MFMMKSLNLEESIARFVGLSDWIIYADCSIVSFIELGQAHCITVLYVYQQAT